MKKRTKQRYEIPVMNIIWMENQDIITTSGDKDGTITDTWDQFNMTPETSNGWSVN